jgi:PAS domain S-box-containing protein
VIIAIILASGITKPIRKLVEGTRRISKEDYAYNIEPTAKDEVEYLTRTFNDMSSLLIQTKKQLQDYENNLKKKVEDKTKEVTIKARQQEVEAVLITNIDGTIEYVNPEIEKTTGYPVSEVLGQNPRILKSGKQSDDFYKELWETILAGKIWRGNLINKKKDGALYHEEMTIAPVKDQSGLITNFVAIKCGIHNRKE